MKLGHRHGHSAARSSTNLNSAADAGRFAVFNQKDDEFFMVEGGEKGSQKECNSPNDVIVVRTMQESHRGSVYGGISPKAVPTQNAPPV